MSAARKLLPDAAQDCAPWYMRHLAPRGAYRVAFTEHGMREQASRVRCEQILIDDQTGAFLERFGYLSGTPTDRFLVWMYPLHSGKSWGLTGSLAIALSGLCAALVCMTGMLRWLKRRGMAH